jgi:hypothetical protein
MTIRQSVEAGGTERLARLTAENARLAKLAADLAADVGQLRAALAARRTGAPDPAARRLLVVHRNISYAQAGGRADADGDPPHRRRGRAR